MEIGAVLNTKEPPTPFEIQTIANKEPFGSMGSFSVKFLFVYSLNMMSIILPALPHNGYQCPEDGFHLCTIKVPMVYIIGQLECATYQCYFINVLFDIIF